MSQQTYILQELRRCGAHRCGIRLTLIGLGVVVLLASMIPAASAQASGEADIDQTWYLTGNGSGLPKDHYWMFLGDPSDTNCNALPVPTAQSRGELFFIAYNAYGNGEYLNDTWYITLHQWTGNANTVNVSIGVWNRSTNIYNASNFTVFDPGSKDTATTVEVNTTYFTTQNTDEYLALRIAVDIKFNYGIKPCLSYVRTSFLTIGDFVWYDCNCTDLQCQSSSYDGIQNEVGQGVDNVTVTLYWNDTRIQNKEPSCSEDLNDYTIVKIIVGNTTHNSTHTADGGYYRFDKLKPGCFCLEFNYTTNTTHDWAGWTLQNQTDADKDNKDSDVYPSNGMTEFFYGRSGEILSNWDAGVVTLAIGGLVWNDCFPGYYDGNLSDDERENARIPGVNVCLYYNETSETGGFTQVGCMQTDENGTYSFEELPLGWYYLKFERNGSCFWVPRGNDSFGNDSAVNPDNTTDPFNPDPCLVELNAGRVCEPACPPISEMGTVALFSVGLFTLAGYVVVRRRR